MTMPQYPPNMPRKVAAAGALFLNEAGHVLLVNPTYKPVWEIPGGMVENFEAPRAACIREVAEEIGLAIEPGPLLGLDYAASQASGREVLRFIFWGGVLDAGQIAAIRLPAEELSEYGFFDLPTAKTLLSAKLGEQIGRILAARERGETFVYTEHAITPAAK